MAAQQPVYPMYWQSSVQGREAKRENFRKKRKSSDVKNVNEININMKKRFSWPCTPTINDQHMGIIEEVYTAVIRPMAY